MKSEKSKPDINSYCVWIHYEYFNY